MGRKDSARGPFAERCFLLGPFRSAASADAPLRREASSSSLVQVGIGLPALQLRFLATSCLAGACVAGLAAGWRVLARPSNILTSSESKAEAPGEQATKAPLALASKVALACPVAWPGTRALAGLALLRKAAARGLLHRPWGVLKGAHDS